MSFLSRLWGSSSSPSAQAQQKPRLTSPEESQKIMDSMRGRRVLVTGGAGYIGSHTCVELLEVGFDVVVVDNLDNSSIESLRRVEKITGKHVEFHLLDLRNEDSLELLFDKSPPFDAVIHFAGLKAVGESVKEPLRYYDNNLGGLIILLKVMARHGVFRLIFSSSATVYGNQEDPSAIPETASRSSTNPYGRTKLFIEEILRDVARTDPRWRIVLLRYFNPVGAHPSGLIGEDPRGIPNNLMPFVCQVAAGKRPHLDVFGNDFPTSDGTGVRDYIHVVDLARGHVSALINGIYLMMEHHKILIDVFNLGTGRGYSVLDMVQAMRKASNREIPYRIVGRREGDPPCGTVLADPSKALRELGWKATLGLDRMCEDAWRWQHRNPDGYATPAVAADGVADATKPTTSPKGAAAASATSSPQQHSSSGTTPHAEAAASSESAAAASQQCNLTAQFFANLNDNNRALYLYREEGDSARWRCTSCDRVPGQHANL